MRPVFDLHRVAPRLWEGWIVYHDGEQYHEVETRKTQLAPLASWAIVRVNGKRWNPPPPTVIPPHPNRAH